MKEFKGTNNGEWVVKGNTVFVKDTTIKIATVSVVKNYEDVTFKPIEDVECIANTRLIACAPEMLDMLIKMQEAMSELDNLQEGWEETRDELDKLVKKALRE